MEVRLWLVVLVDEKQRRIIERKARERQTPTSSIKALHLTFHQLSTIPSYLGPIKGLVIHGIRDLIIWMSLEISLQIQMLHSSSNYPNQINFTINVGPCIVLGEWKLHKISRQMSNMWTWEARRGCWISLELELQVAVCHLTGILGTKLRSSGRVASAYSEQLRHLVKHLACGGLRLSWVDGATVTKMAF